MDTAVPLGTDSIGAPELGGDEAPGLPEEELAEAGFSEDGAAGPGISDADDAEAGISVAEEAIEMSGSPVAEVANARDGTEL